MKSAEEIYLINVLEAVLKIIDVKPLELSGQKEERSRKFELSNIQQSIVVEDTHENHDDLASAKQCMCKG